MKTLLLLVISFVAVGQSVDEQLLRAIKSGNLSLAKELISKGANANTRDHNGIPAIYWAAYRGGVESVRMLIQAKADANIKAAIILSDGSYYGSLLAIAAAENKLTLLRYLIEEINMPVDLQEYNPEEKLENGWTALQWACSNSHVNIIKYLIAKGAKVNNYNDVDSSPLLLTLMRPNSLCVDALVKGNPSLTIASSSGVVPVFYAIANHDAKTLEVLLNAGLPFKDVKLVDKSPFQYALANGYIDHALVLLNKGADANSPLPDKTWPLGLASKNGYEDLVKALISKKANVNYANADGITALMYAAYNNQLKICKLLLRAGANKLAASKVGKTALDYAKDNNVLESIAYLTNEKDYQEPDQWQQFNNKMVMYVNANQNDKALQVSEAALNYVMQKEGAGSLSFGKACLNHVRLLHHLGKYEASISYIQKIIPIYQKSSGQQNEAMQELINRMGTAFYQSGQYQNAITWQESLPDSFSKFTNLAEAHYALGNYADAERFYLLAQQISDKSVGQRLYLDNNLGILYMDMGKLSESEAHLSSVLKTFQEIGDTKEYNLLNHLNAIHNYADLLRLQGNYDRAEQYEKYVIENIQKNKLEDNRLYANALNSLGDEQMLMGRYDEAEKTLVKALQVKASILGKNHPGYGNGLVTLGALYSYRNDYKKAEDFLDEAALRVAATAGKKSTIYVSARSNLATLYGNQNQYEDAARVQIDLIKHMDSTDLKNTLTYAQLLGNYANSLSGLKRYNEALQWQERAMMTLRELAPATHPLYLEELMDLALLQQVNKRNSEAKANMNLGMQGFSQYMEKTFSVMDEKKQLAFSALTRQYLKDYQQFAINQGQSDKETLSHLLNYQLALKGILLNVQTRNKTQILASGDSAQIKYYHTWQKAKESLSRFYSYSKSELQSRNINLSAWEEETRQLEADLARIASRKLTQEKADWRELQKRLAPQEVAIETIFLDTQFGDSVVNAYAFLLFDKDSQYPELQIITNGKDLNEKYARYYQNAIKGKIQDEFSYQQYWAPLQKSALLQGGRKTIYFSADGVYQKISLAGLWNPDKQQYLFDEHNIQLVTSLKDLMRAKKRSDQGSLILFGYPTYNISPADHERALKGIQTVSTSTENNTSLSNSSTRELSLMEVAELPGTKTEVESIQAMAEERKRPVQVFLGPQALEEAVKAVQNPAILHIATHGYFLKQVDEGGTGGKLLGIQADKLIENPLLRSGLLFTGSVQGLNNSTTGENGILTAYEAMNLTLDKTELVVLSACETGLGEVRTGEGVYGLQRAFTAAGAQSLLMSLWTVSDEATQVLMTNFYKQYLKGKPAAEALITAQKETRKLYAHPYYWSAFVLVGASR